MKSTIFFLPKNIPRKKLTTFFRRSSAMELMFTKILPPPRPACRAGNVDSKRSKFMWNPSSRRRSGSDHTPRPAEKTNDPVRVYLREMGVVPLLTREHEVAIAKRIERGHLRVLKAISRSPLVLKELFSVAVELRNGDQAIKKIIHFDDEELTEEKIEDKTKQTLKIIDKIEGFTPSD